MGPKVWYGTTACQPHLNPICSNNPKVGMLGNEVHALETQDQWLCNTCKHNGVEEGKTLFVTQPWFLPARDQVGQGGEAVINALCTNGHLCHAVKSRTSVHTINCSRGSKACLGGQLQGGCNLCVQISLKSMCTCSPDRIEGKHHGTFNMACVQPEKAHQKKWGLLSNCRQYRRLTLEFCIAANASATTVLPASDRLTTGQESARPIRNHPPRSEPQM